MLLIEKKMPQNGHVVYFGLNDFQVFSDFYKAYYFATRLNDFTKYLEMVDGNERNLIEDKERLKALYSIKLQLEEQEAFAQSNKEVLDIISQLRVL